MTQSKDAQKEFNLDLAEKVAQQRRRGHVSGVYCSQVRADLKDAAISCQSSFLAVERSKEIMERSLQIMERLRSQI